MIKYLYKNAFAVIGKMGQGTGDSFEEWVMPLWDAAESGFNEVENIVRKSESSSPLYWGALNDTDESNKRWGEEGFSDTGKFMASYEADADVTPPDGWAKWIIPAQTYMVVSRDAYAPIAERFGSKIVGSVHSFFPEPGNDDVVDYYVPIATGMIFCQSCYMPLVNPDDFGLEADGEPSVDYCCHCYAGGKFADEMTFEEAVERNIPFWKDGGATDEVARGRIREVFPTLKRWKTV